MNNIFEINSSYTPELISMIASALKNGNVVIMPSDTIYGFLSLPAGELKIREIKKRDNKPFLYLISDLAQLGKLGIEKSDYIEMLDKYWPGPVTFIMKRNKPVLDNYFDTIGVRLPQWDILREIISRAGSPLISTSVNFSGDKSIGDPDEILENFSGLADLIIIDRNFSNAVSSTIVDLSVKPFKVLRKGNIEFNENQ